MQVTTLRPGLLVSLKTKIVGNRKYRTTEIEAEHYDDNGALVARTETERTIRDPEEYQRAIKSRSVCRSAITRVCAQSEHGLLCLTTRRNALAQAIDAARKEAAEFNAGAIYTQLAVNVVVGEIAQDDVEAVKAINYEIRNLLDAMDSGIRNADVEAIRKAANTARGLQQMVTEEANQRLAFAISTARDVARKIVATGETAATELDAIALKRIQEGRLAFLDLDAGEDMVDPVAATARGIDLDPDDDMTPAAKSTLLAILSEYDGPNYDPEATDTDEVTKTCLASPQLDLD
jgi:hypothetical protein